MSVGGTVMPNRTNQFIVLQHRHNKECANTGDLDSRNRQWATYLTFAPAR